MERPNITPKPVSCEHEKHFCNGVPFCAMGHNIHDCSNCLFRENKETEQKAM